MRDRGPNYPEYTLVPVDRSQEDPMSYPNKLFYMVDSEVMVDFRFDFKVRAAVASAQWTKVVPPENCEGRHSTPAAKRRRR